jgi:uncharacterized protein (DUF433 family)
LNWKNHIEQRIDILCGKPVFQGTRTPVKLLLTELGSGLSQEEILSYYTPLKSDHLRAALLFAVAVPRKKGRHSGGGNGPFRD